jgi:hypothetical protein
VSAPGRRRAWHAIVAAASVLVPGDRRTEWRREWDAELQHVESRGGPALRTALGAFADALEVGMGPRAFADAARFGYASLARSPLHVAGAAAVLAAGIAMAGICLALAARVVAGQGMRGAGLVVLLVAAVPVLLALAGTAAAAGASLIRRAIEAQREGAPCSAEEARAASAVLCAGAGGVALLLAGAATARFPDAIRPGGWDLWMGIGAVLGPVLLLAAVAGAAVRHWVVDRHHA